MPTLVDTKADSSRCRRPDSAFRRSTRCRSHRAQSDDAQSTDLLHHWTFREFSVRAWSSHPDKPGVGCSSIRVLRPKRPRSPGSPNGLLSFLCFATVCSKWCDRVCDSIIHCSRRSKQYRLCSCYRKNHICIRQRPRSSLLSMDKRGMLPEKTPKCKSADVNH